MPILPHWPRLRGSGLPLGLQLGRAAGDRLGDHPGQLLRREPQFLQHGERAELLDQLGLTPQQLARVVTEMVARRTPDLEPERQA